MSSRANKTTAKQHYNYEGFDDEEDGKLSENDNTKKTSFVFMKSVGKCDQGFKIRLFSVMADFVFLFLRFS